MKKKGLFAISLALLLSAVWTPISVNAAGEVPVYRVFNRSTGEHLYTTSAGEKDVLVRKGWANEGIAWYSNGAPVLNTEPAAPVAQPTQSVTPSAPVVEPIVIPGSTEESRKALAGEVLSLVNEERAKYGLKPLSTNAKLAEAATIRATETTQLFDHKRPNGEDCFTIIDEMNIDCMGASENIAAGQRSAEQVMNSWMNSPGHRANILGDSDEVGIGVVLGPKGLYWAQLFISK